MNTRPCHECGTETLPMMTVRGPFAFEAGAVDRPFCSMHCFWKWSERAMDERSENYSLDRQMNWKETRRKN